MQHILLYVLFSCQSTFLNQKPQQAVCVNEKVENQKQNGDITFCVPVVKKTTASESAYYVIHYLDQ